MKEEFGRRRYATTSRRAGKTLAAAIDMSAMTAQLREDANKVARAVEKVKAAQQELADALDTAQTTARKIAGTAR